MVPVASQIRLTYLYIEGLKESIRGLVRALNRTTLDDAIQKALRLEITSSKDKPYSKNLT